jgi:hypothetical protein
MFTLEIYTNSIAQFRKITVLVFADHPQQDKYKLKNTANSM